MRVNEKAPSSFVFVSFSTEPVLCCKKKIFPTNIQEKFGVENNSNNNNSIKKIQKKKR